MRQGLAGVIGAVLVVAGLAAERGPTTRSPRPEGRARVQPALRLPRAGRGAQVARRGPSRPAHPVEPGQERRGARPLVRHDQQPEDRAGPRQAGDVRRRQHPRQRGPGGRGVPVHDLVPGRELRAGREHHQELSTSGPSTSSRPSTPTAGPSGSPGRTRPTARGAASPRATTTATASSTRTATTTSTATARSPRCGKKDPNGRFKLSPDDPRLLVPVKPGEKGEYELLGLEGIDNDGDGLINEDPPGGYDMNRNWPADWQPDHIQGGAGDFPLSLARDPGDGRVHPRPPQHRGRPGVPQRRRDDPPRPRPPLPAGRLSRGRRPDRRGDRPRRRADDPVLPELRHPPRPLLRPRRVRRLDL